MFLLLIKVVLVFLIILFVIFKFFDTFCKIFYDLITKTGLKSLVEKTFSVKVNSLNSYIPASKKKRLNKYTGFKSNFKRIIVTLV